MNALPPKISLGLPVYNGERYLPNALTRLLQQDFEDFELIVCDNASTDRTQEICLAFAVKDSRIRYFRNERNLGLAANHNRAFELSRGQYFKWVSHDDDFPPNMLSGLLRAFEKGPPGVSVVYSHCEYIDEHGNVQGIDSDGVDKNDAWPHRRLSHLLREIHMYNCPYGLIRSDILRKTRLFGLYPGADHVLFAELAMLGILVEIPEHLLRIRRHSGRTFTANKNKKALRELFAPGQAHRFSFISIKARMKIELIRSALTIPLRPRDRILCTAVAILKPQWEAFRSFGGRQKRKLFPMLYPASSLSERSPQDVNDVIHLKELNGVDHSGQ